MSRFTASFLASLLFLLGAACTSDEEPPTEGSRFVTSGTCEREEELVADESLRDEGRLEGDVDGDGSDDTAFLVRTRGEPDCSVFLVVETAGATLSAPVATEGGSASLGLPSLTGLAQIDGRPGVDIYLTVLAGASTEFLAVYSAGAGQLDRLSRGDGALGDLFPSGGSVAHVEASDCRAEGGIVVAEATRNEPGWSIVSGEYDFDGESFVQVGESRDQAGRIRGFVEFGSTPFGSCSTSPE